MGITDFGDSEPQSNLPQELINKSGKNSTKQLTACVKAGSGHFEYS